MKNGIKVAIVRPLLDYQERELQEPLGAEAICGYLRQNGIVCSVFDRRVGDQTEDIRRFKPDLVGFSLMTQADVRDALRLLQQLKTDNIRFFAGGLFVTTDIERARALFPKDTVLIRGEGEQAVLELAGGRADTALMHPDKWAFASRDEADKYLKCGGVFNIRSSRGCRGNCAFCVTPGMKEASVYTARSISLIADEIEAIKNSGYPCIINFTDDEFGDISRIEELEDELKRRDIIAAFSLEMRASAMYDNEKIDWKKLKSGGLCRIFTGLESLNPHTLLRWNKPVNTEKLLRTLDSCRTAGIICETGYILWHRDQTPEQALEELRVLHSQGLFTPKAAVSRLVLFPGSRMHSVYDFDGVHYEPLSTASERMYLKLEDGLGEMRESWYISASKLPGACCRAFLSGDMAEKNELEKCLAVLNEKAFAETEKIFSQ